MPLDGSIIPSNIRNSVVLPAPLGPSSRNRAGGNGQADPIDGAVSPKSLTRFLASTASISLAVDVEGWRTTEIPAKMSAHAVKGRRVLKSQSLEEAIRAEAARLGFASCGFARADAADGAGLELSAGLKPAITGRWSGWRSGRTTVSPR